MTPTEDAIELTAEGVDPNAFMLQNVDTTPGPTFSVGEIGKFFFDASDHTLRLWEKKGFFTFNGKEVGTRRAPSGARQYTLSDVEMVAHALAQHGEIDGERLSLIVTAACVVARIYGYLDADQMAVGSEVTQEPM